MVTFPPGTNPVKIVRKLLGKSQPEFASWFGKSDSYIQKVELGKKDLSQHVADAIMLRLGIDSESLKKKSGWPVSLLDTKRFFFPYRNPYADASKKDNTAAVRKLDRELAKLAEIKQPALRLKRSMEFWQKNAEASYWEENTAAVGAALNVKLTLMFLAAQQRGNYPAVALMLSRWIEQTIVDFRLRNTITQLRLKHSIAVPDKKVRQEERRRFDKGWRSVPGTHEIAWPSVLAVFGIWPKRPTRKRKVS
jgi:transcriptional regulator with XRE-family HTH domain